MNRIIRNYASDSVGMFTKLIIGQQLTVDRPQSIVVIVRFVSTITSCCRLWTVNS